VRSPSFCRLLFLLSLEHVWLTLLAFCRSVYRPGLDPHLADLQHLTAPLNVSIVQMNKAEVTKEEFRDKSADSLMEWIVSFDADAPEHQGKVTWCVVLLLRALE
jgi:hypothetical protein